MRVRIILLVVALAFTGSAAGARKDDDEPVVAKKKLSEWLEVLQDKNSPLWKQAPAWKGSTRGVHSPKSMAGAVRRVRYMGALTSL